jgi:heme-degrading monooxygenase HmoA
MSVLERVEISAKEGMAGTLLAALRGQGAALLTAVPGCLAVRSGGGVEQPDKVILLVDWASLDAHEAFKKTPDYVTLAQMIFPLAAGAAAEHFSMA